MNLQELRTFLTIIDTGSLVRASEILNVTQSTVTARLKSLEEEIGQTLLIRNKSGATLTAAGLRLHRYADTISDLWHQARQETALPDGMSGVCNLACEYDLWANLGERLFQAIQEDHPEIAVSIWLGSQTEVATWLNEGKSDMAFSYGSTISQRQGQVELNADELVLVSTSQDSPIRFDPSYVYVEAGEAFGREHAAAYADAGTARISFGNAALGMEHLIKVGGSAYLPLRITQDKIAAKALFVLPEAASFKRAVFLNFNRAAREAWDWLDPILQREFRLEAKDAA